MDRRRRRDPRQALRRLVPRPLRALARSRDFYDWRKDLRHAAAALDRFIAPARAVASRSIFVGRSMGGLVTHSSVLEHPARSRSLERRLRDARHAQPQLMQHRRSLPICRERLRRELLALGDFRELSFDDLCACLDTFPGSYRAAALAGPRPAPAAPLYEARRMHASRVLPSTTSPAHDSANTLAAQQIESGRMLITGSGKPSFMASTPPPGRPARYRSAWPANGISRTRSAPSSTASNLPGNRQHRMAGSTRADAGMLRALRRLLKHRAAETLAERPPACAPQQARERCTVPAQAHNDADKEAPARPRFSASSTRGGQTSAGARGRAAPAAGTSAGSPRASTRSTSWSSRAR